MKNASIFYLFINRLQPITRCNISAHNHSFFGKAINITSLVKRITIDIGRKKQAVIDIQIDLMDSIFIRRTRHSIIRLDTKRYIAPYRNRLPYRVRTGRSAHRFSFHATRRISQHPFMRIKNEVTNFGSYIVCD